MTFPYTGCLGKQGQLARKSSSVGPFDAAILVVSLSIRDTFREQGEISLYFEVAIMRKRIELIMSHTARATVSLCRQYLIGTSVES